MSKFQYKYQFRFTNFDLVPQLYTHSSPTRLTKEQLRALAAGWAKSEGIQNCIFVAEVTEYPEHPEYDRLGRMKYHPEFHPNHAKPYTTKELAYICQNYSWGMIKVLSLDVGRTERTIYNLICKLRKEGTFDHYTNMVLEE